jgi:hypothetical protein
VDVVLGRLPVEQTMRTNLTRNGGAALLRALLENPDGLTTRQVADRTRYTQNHMSTLANLAAYDGLITQVGIGPGPGRPAVWAIHPDHRATLTATLTAKDQQ